MKAFCKQYRDQIIVAFVGLILTLVMIVITERRVDRVETEMHQAVQNAL